MCVYMCVFYFISVSIIDKRKIRVLEVEENLGREVIILNIVFGGVRRMGNVGLCSIVNFFFE